MSATGVPLPPLALAERVGSLRGLEDPLGHFDRYGVRLKRDIYAAIGWETAPVGARILDFGCGAGRLLRHLLPEARAGEVEGCDIDAASIDWIESALSPPLTVWQSSEAPPLPRPDGHYDLVIALSVFSHLGANWPAWLIELHRVLKPGGLLVATFIGPGMHRLFLGEDAREERIGMAVLQPGQPWDLGGPMVLHSPWWLRARWGRAFEPMRIEPSGLASEPGNGQGIFVGAKRAVVITPEALEACDPGESREGPAAAFSAELLERYGAQQRSRADDAVAWAENAERRLAEVQRRLDQLVTSRSWRITRPLRATVAALRRVGPARERQ